MFANLNNIPSFKPFVLEQLQGDLSTQERIGAKVAFLLERGVNWIKNSNNPILKKIHSVLIDFLIQRNQIIREINTYTHFKAKLIKLETKSEKINLEFLADFEILNGQSLKISKLAKICFPYLHNRLKKEKDELKSYTNLIAVRTSQLKLNPDAVANYIDLRRSFVEETLPLLNSEDYKNSIQESIGDIFVSQLDAYYAIDKKKRPRFLQQFEKDIPRKTQFKRIDTFLKIDDKESYPSPDSSAKLSEASKAIADLMINRQERKHWIPILQVVITQTNLNGAFMKPKIDLSFSGSQVRWCDGDKEYALMPTFSQEGMPPIGLEIIRDHRGRIEKVNVSVEGTLDLVKKPANFNGNIGQVEEVQNGATIQPHKNELIVKDAVQTKLTYTLTMNQTTKRPIISNFQCSTSTSIGNPD